MDSVGKIKGYLTSSESSDHLLRAISISEHEASFRSLPEPTGGIRMYPYGV